MEKQFVAFKIASAYYCIDIMNVKEVIREKNITKMPNFPSFVEGVINLRGRITPLISIDKRLGANQDNFSQDENYLSVTIDKPLKLIIINVDNLSIGLLVESLDKILVADDSQLQNAEGLGAASSHQMVVGMLQVEGVVYTVLDPRFILEIEETQQLSQTII